VIDAQHHQLAIIVGYVNPVNDKIRHTRYAFLEGTVHQPWVAEAREHRKQREDLANAIDDALRSDDVALADECFDLPKISLSSASVANSPRSAWPIA
jgi:hypothetical protein